MLLFLKAKTKTNKKNTTCFASWFPDVLVFLETFHHFHPEYCSLSHDIWLFLAASYKKNSFNLTLIFWHWPILGLALTCLLTIHRYCLEEGQVFIHTFPPLLSAGWPSAQIHRLVVYGQHSRRLSSSHADQLFNFLRITLARILLTFLE